MIIAALFATAMFTKPIVDFRDSNLQELQKMEVYERPDYILMMKGKNSDVIILSDLELKKADHYRKLGYKKVVAFLMEPRAVNEGMYQFIDLNIRKFDLVFTYDRYLLTKYPKKCKFVHAVVPGFISEIGVHPKSRLCSMSVGRTDETQGRKLRKEVFDLYRDYLDVYKTNDMPSAASKDEWLNDLCFSIVIENSKEPDYFSEKILDCFRTGTIPIYWGTSTIGSYFDERGIITFDSVKALGEILEGLSFEEYNARFSAVERNFELAAKFPPFDLRNRESFCIMDCLWPYLQCEL